MGIETARLERDTHTHIQEQLIFDKNAKAIEWITVGFQQRVMEQLAITHTYTHTKRTSNS